MTNPEEYQNTDLEQQKNESDEATNLPSINIDQQSIAETMQAKALISSDKMTTYYEEAIDCIREDRGEAAEMYQILADMVTNDGDGTAATKEAMVNCLKLKSDSVDKMTKILDLWTRMHLKERDTFPRYLAVQQNNKIDSGPSTKTQLIRLLNDMDKAKGED